MGIKLSEKIGINVDWEKVVWEAFKENDYERLQHAMDASSEVANKVVNSWLFASAAKSGDSKMLAFLLKFQIDFGLSFFANHLIKALEANAPMDCLKVLLDVMNDNNDIKLNFVDIVTRSNPEFVELLFNKFPPPAVLLRETFHQLATAGNLGTLEFFKTKMPDNYFRANFLEDVLISAVLGNSETNDQADQSETVAKLIEWGANPNFVFSEMDSTCLSVAASRGKKDVVIELLLNGATDADGKARESARKSKQDEIIKIISNAEKGILPVREADSFWQKLQAARIANSLVGERDDGFRFV